MNKQQLVDIVCEAIKEANGQRWVVHKGLTTDNICNVSRDEMDEIEDEYNIIFVEHGSCILIKIGDVSFRHETSTETTLVRF